MTRINLPVGCTPEVYDHYTAVGVDIYDRMLIQRLTDEFARLGKRSARVLDACTGTGQLLIRVAEVFNESTFVAFDLFPDMVERAKENVAAAGLSDRVRVEVADIHDLPYEDGSFDLIMARSVVHHWAEPEKAFKELERVLAPRGVAVIHEPRRDPSPDAYEAVEAERRVAGVRPANLEEKYTADEVRLQLSRAGVRKYDVFAEESGPAAIGFEVRIEQKLRHAAAQ